MKRKTTNKDDKSLWTNPGKMTQEEFFVGIRKAEEGPFYTIKELKRNIRRWKKDNGYL